MLRTRQSWEWHWKQELQKRISKFGLSLGEGYSTPVDYTLDCKDPNDFIIPIIQNNITFPAMVERFKKQILAHFDVDIITE